ncbi:MAG: MBL fold metallo-hydrolase [Stellaceae bacterium]
MCAATYIGSSDYVLCTHLHADHVGWNTRLVGGRWVPTFPNARYLFARREWEHWREAELRAAYTTDPYYEDSLLPVMDSGQADLVATDYAFDDSRKVKSRAERITSIYISLGDSCRDRLQGLVC